MRPTDEGGRGMSELVDLLRPAYTDDEQVTAKQLQKGLGALRKQFRLYERLVVTSHGHPEIVMLRYQDVKKLWETVNNLIEQAEDTTLSALATERLKDHREERISLERGLAQM